MDNSILGSEKILNNVEYLLHSQPFRDIIRPTADYFLLPYLCYSCATNAIGSSSSTITLGGVPPSSKNGHSHKQKQGQTLCLR
jgi:hypothetical protein